MRPSAPYRGRMQDGMSIEVCSMASTETASTRKSSRRRRANMAQMCVEAASPSFSMFAPTSCDWLNMSRASKLIATPAADRRAPGKERPSSQRLSSSVMPYAKSRGGRRVVEHNGVLVSMPEGPAPSHVRPCRRKAGGGKYTFSEDEVAVFVPPRLTPQNAPDGVPEMEPLPTSIEVYERIEYKLTLLEPLDINDTICKRNNQY